MLSKFLWPSSEFRIRLGDRLEVTSSLMSNERFLGVLELFLIGTLDLSVLFTIVSNSPTELLVRRLFKAGDVVGDNFTVEFGLIRLFGGLPLPLLTGVLLSSSFSSTTSGLGYLRGLPLFLVIGVLFPTTKSCSFGFSFEDTGCSILTGYFLGLPRFLFTGSSISSAVSFRELLLTSLFEFFLSKLLFSTCSSGVESSVTLLLSLLNRLEVLGVKILLNVSTGLGEFNLELRRGEVKASR